MPKITAFELHADAYDEWFEEHDELYRAELALIRELIPSEAPRKVEIGVGSGKFARPFSIQVGVEPSAKMAQKAKQLGIEVHHGIAEQLPFEEKSFDFALMVTTICFVDDPLKSFEEVHRILDDKGLFIVAFVDKNSHLGKQYETKREKSKFYKEATFFSTEELLDLLKKSHFQPLKIRQTLLPERDKLDHIIDGFGQGAFVAILAEKIDRINN